MAVQIVRENIIGEHAAAFKALELSLECVFFKVAALPNTLFHFIVESGDGVQTSRSSETAYLLPSDSEFDAMTMAQLCSWYLVSVGYVPLEDCPAIDVAHVRENCKEHALIERCNGLDSLAYQLTEAGRKAASGEIQN